MFVETYLFIIRLFVRTIAHLCLSAGVFAFPHGDQPHVRRFEHQQGRVESSRRRPRGQDEGYWRREEKTGRRRSRRWVIVVCKSGMLPPSLPLSNSPGHCSSPYSWRGRQVEDVCYLLDVQDLDVCLDVCLYNVCMCMREKVAGKKIKLLM